MGAFGGIGKKLFGSGSGNTRIGTQTAEQKALMNQYLNALGIGAGDTMSALNGYAANGYNPYDSARGDEVFGSLIGENELSRRNQIDSVKGGPLNRFSLASGAMNNGINANARKLANDLNLQNLNMKTQANQQSYGNQMDAIRQALGLGTSLSGMNTFQNREDIDGGWLAKADRLNNNAAGATQAFGNLFGGIKGAAAMA